MKVPKRSKGTNQRHTKITMAHAIIKATKQKKYVLVIKPIIVNNKINSVNAGSPQEIWSIMAKSYVSIVYICMPLVDHF